MKPKNNRIFCPDCGKAKMLFETERKAQNFIRFNGQDILRDGQTIDQLRVYYCPSCCGYHITSKPFKETYSHNTERLLTEYNKSKANKAVLRALKYTDDKVIKDIQKEAQYASVTSKKELRRFITGYFAQHTQYTKQQQDDIRHKINQMLK